MTESQINSRKQMSSSNPKGSKLTVSATKPSAKLAGPKIFVDTETSSPLPTVSALQFGALITLS